MKKLIIFFMGALALCASGAVKVPGIFSDHAVLAKKAVVPIFGKADPGEKVTVTFDKQRVSTTAGKDGRWRVNLNLANSPEGPFELKINELVIKDVIVGEVWLCSGQSNMAFGASSSSGYKQEVANPVGSRLRNFSVKRNSSKEPLSELEGSWRYASANEIKYFSGVAYFFGKKVLMETNRPVGLIKAAWGGTDISAWMDWQALSEVPTALKRAKNKDAKTPSKRERVKPTRLYNAMIHPFIPYALSGVIWYQGERASNWPEDYAQLTRSLVKQWRRDFEFPEMPFYWCNLANYRAKNPDPNAKSSWALVREQQTLALDVPHTGQAILIDVGEAGNIHPVNKKTPGERLAAIALAKVYGKKIPFAGPMVSSVKRQGSELVISFTNICGGLDARELPAEYVAIRAIKARKGVKGRAAVVAKLERYSPNAQLQGFAICGKDGKYFWADKAEIRGDKVVVSSSKVTEPAGVRYAWQQNPTCNLYNKAGFPAVPFSCKVDK